MTRNAVTPPHRVPAFLVALLASATTPLLTLPARSAYAAPAPARTLTPPKLVTFVEAELPPGVHPPESGVAVVLQIAIRADGQVAQVAVVESAGAVFDAAAKAAAERFAFEPATADGKPIPVKITYRYELTWKPEVVVKTTADFEGTVRDRATNNPIKGVNVTLSGGVQATSDDDGRFRFANLPPGTTSVTLSAADLTTVATEEVLEAGKKLDATYEVERKAAVPEGEEDDLEIVITAPRISKQVVSTEVAAEQGRRIPGASGDVLKVVENLPGVARAAVGSGALVVWGAAPEDTRVYVDGVRVPRLYHDGGYRSVVHSDMVRAVELVPGGYGPAYGRGLGGLVTVQLRPLDEDGIHGSVAADTIDASAAVRAKIGERLHVAVAARRSYLDRVLGAVSSEDVGSIVPLPRYADGQARIALDLGEHESIELGAMLSTDLTERTLASADPALTKRQTTGLDFGRVYARYQKRLDDGGRVDVVPSYGRDSSRLVSRFGPTPTELRSDTEVYGLRASWRGAIGARVGVGVGLDADAASASIHRAGSIGAPPREGDVRVFGQAPSDQINADDWKTVSVALGAWAEADISLLDDRLHVTPGARFEPYMTTANRVVPRVGDAPSLGFAREESVVEPRISVRFAATPRVAAKAAFGVYHQAPQAEDLSSVFGSPRLGLAQARHYLAGGAFKLTPTLDVEVTAFYAESSDLVARSASASPRIAQALDQTGQGRSYGTQMLLRQAQVGRFFGWVSYSILRSERKDGPSRAWRLFDYDQSHVLTALGSLDLGRGFEVGARFRFATGFPRTPVTCAYYDALADAYQPRFGAQNAERIPAFASLDVRLAKRFKAGATEGEVYLDVQNVTNHSNPEEIVYDPSYATKAYITGLPVLPVIGARWSW